MHAGSAADVEAARRAPLRRMPGEPAYWFRRFLRYVARGPGRSVLSLYAVERAERLGLGPEAVRPSQVPGAWKRGVRRWAWRERAEAWEAVQARARFAAYEQRCRARLAPEPEPEPESLEGALCRLMLAAVETHERAGGKLREVDRSRVLRALGYLLTASQVRGSGRRWTARAAQVLSGVRLGHTRRKPVPRLGQSVGAARGVSVASDNI